MGVTRQSNIVVYRCDRKVCSTIYANVIRPHTEIETMEESYADALAVAFTLWTQINGSNRVYCYCPKHKPRRSQALAPLM